MLLQNPLFLTSHWMKNPVPFGIQSFPNQWRCNFFFSAEFLMNLKAPRALVWSPHRVALTAVLTSIKGDSFLECKSTMLLMSSLHLPAVLVNICNSTTGNTSGTGQVLKNGTCFMVFFFLFQFTWTIKYFGPNEMFLWKLTSSAFFSPG